MLTKQCIKCGDIKDIDDFAKREDSKDGRRNVCEDCIGHYQKKYRDKTKSLRKQKYERSIIGHYAKYFSGEFGRF